MIRFGNITIDRRTHTITHGALSRKWQMSHRDDRTNGVGFAIMTHLLLGGGMNREQIFEATYGEQADGGPLYGLEIVRIVIANLEPEIEKLGLALRTSRHNSRTLYWVAAPAHA